MTARPQGAIDCDIHPPAPPVSLLLPYLDDYWREQVVNRHIDRAPFNLTSYPKTMPLSGRPDWRGADGAPGGDLGLLRREVLDRFGTRLAICNLLHGVVTLFNTDLSMALTGAVNDYLKHEWLDAEPRLRGSILINPHDPDLAVAEIERHAADPRFVQVLMLVMEEAPLGRRTFWPIYEAAQRHGLAVGVHAGSAYRWAPSVAGWPSTHFEDYVLQSAAFENLLTSFLAQGVFAKFPDLRLVLIESGFLWLPTLLWRVDKTWRGVRSEVPWVDRAPSEILRERVFVTLQPVDAPDARAVARSIEHIGTTDMLLFSTDYPHWQFDGDAALPEGLPEAALPAILSDNALRAYPRLSQAADRAAHAVELETRP